MKKVLTLVFLTIVSNICIAQNLNAALPVDGNKLSLPSAQSLISAYHTTGVLQHPTSYILNVSDLINYLNTQNSGAECYLHAYFGTDNAGVTYMIFVPTFITYNPLSGAVTQIYHDPSITNVFATSANELTPGYCYEYDYRLDDISDAGRTTPCNVTYPTNTISLSTAKNWIATYQAAHPQASYTQSFDISSTNLMSLINSNAVTYLHIYMGFDINSQAPDKVTLVITGLDASGYPIYSTNGLGSLRAFEQCKPCPICGMALDSRIDHDPQ